MTQSEARRILSALTETMGKDGVLVVHKGEEVPSGAGQSGRSGASPLGRGAEDEEAAVGAADAAEAADGDCEVAWEDLVPGKALRWPKCECGSPKCPDYDASRPRAAERDRRSGRGGT
ncbi:hypothetical protein [Streptomyces fuscigenes]|uniref:hypothetical protein n=1 Tax=Streptomyces fuscigenes TaxID=1528880 RepID=UPI001F3C765A|nr:hypothetical protein [Streptomyces fuscigenes]MCF3962456.1 hypothetical protein [Streptomyces fuscigenes]